MPHLKCLFLSYMMLLPPVATARAIQVFESPIHWHIGTLKSAQVEAAKRGVPIFGVFYMPWCGPSQYLLKTILQNQVLADYVNQYNLPIALDGEVYQDYFQKYGVHGYPSVLLINSAGEEIDRVTGVDESPDVMQAAYRKVIEEGKTPSQLLETLANDPANPEIMFQLLIKYATRERTADALVFKTKIEQDHPSFYAKIRATVLFSIADAFFSSRQYDEAIAYLKFIVDQIPEADHKRAFEFMAISYQRSNRLDAAFDTLEEAIKIFPTEIRFYFNYLGIAYYEKLRINGAVALGEQGRLIDLPYYDKAYLCFLLARVYKLDGNMLKARDLIIEAIALDPQDDYRKFKSELGE